MVSSGTTTGDMINFTTACTTSPIIPDFSNLLMMDQVEDEEKKRKKEQKMRLKLNRKSMFTKKGRY